MKKLVVLAVFSLTTSLVQASEVYRCQARVPRGKVAFAIDYARREPSRIIFKFQDDFSKKTFNGILRVNAFDANNYLSAEGVMKGTYPELHVSLSGSLEPTPTTERYHFGLRAWTESNGRRDWADDIDFGYGNWLDCRRIQ